MFNLKKLEEVLSLPSYSGSEQLVQEYVINFAKSNNIDYLIDFKGNIYLTKGKVKDGEYYPCVVAHMDTVHSDQYQLIKENKRLNIVTNLQNDKTMLTAKNPDNNNKTGIGGDNKCGVFICLEMMLNKEVIKSAFFVQEEIGMMGSREANKEFFEDVGYAIQFDAPTGNWFSVSCNGIKLWSDEFGSVVKPLLETNNINNYSHDPFTDVVQLKQKFDFCCSVMFSGYYRQHTANEYVIVEDVEKALNLGSSMIDSLGLIKYKMLYVKHISKEFF